MPVIFFWKKYLQTGENFFPTFSLTIILLEEQKELQRQVSHFYHYLTHTVCIPGRMRMKLFIKEALPQSSYGCSSSSHGLENSLSQIILNCHIRKCSFFFFLAVQIILEVFCEHLHHLQKKKIQEASPQIKLLSQSQLFSSGR